MDKYGEYFCHNRDNNIYSALNISFQLSFAQTNSSLGSSKVNKYIIICRRLMRPEYLLHIKVSCLYCVKLVINVSVS